MKRPLLPFSVSPWHYLIAEEYKHASFRLHSLHLGVAPQILYLFSAENDQMNVSTIPGASRKPISSTE